MSVGHLKNTVKPESNDHPWDPQKVVVAQKVVVGQRLVNNSVVILAVFGIQGDHCSEVNKGVTVNKYDSRMVAETNNFLKPTEMRRRRHSPMTMVTESETTKEMRTTMKSTVLNHHFRLKNTDGVTA
jgi:hypothetical protein